MRGEETSGDGAGAARKESDLCMSGPIISGSRASEAARQRLQLIIPSQGFKGGGRNER